MAQAQFDAPLGADKTKVTLTNGSSIGTSAVRVTIDPSIAKTKREALLALEAIVQRIIQGTWPAI
ncbi:MAG TPA: hypothetical protein VF457_15630 [Burkholderiaceae bacterium]